MLFRDPGKSQKSPHIIGMIIIIMTSSKIKCPTLVSTLLFIHCFSTSFSLKDLFFQFSFFTKGKNISKKYSTLAQIIIIVHV